LDRDHSSNFTRQQIAFVSYPEGKLTPITRDSNDYSDLSVAASGQVLATVLSEDRWNLFVMSSTSGGADARHIAPARAFTNFTWTRDGQLIDDKDNVLRSVSPDSGTERTFSTEPDSANGDAWACSDGRYIVFLLGLHGGKSNQNIWRADSSGGNLKQLTNGRLDNYPVCSPDARWVYYIDDSERKLTRVPIDGGASQKVTDVPMEGFFDISPDGSTVAFATVSHAGEHQEKLALVATESGEVRKLLDFERPRIGLLRFTRDGKAVVYAVRENGTDNLWQQPLDGSKGRALTAFKSERIWDFHWSWDGNRLALIRGHTDSDVVLINNQQP
jgi:Tol biopolymer transport system component